MNQLFPELFFVERRKINTNVYFSIINVLTCDTAWYFSYFSFMEYVKGKNTNNEFADNRFQVNAIRTDLLH